MLAWDVELRETRRVRRENGSKHENGSNENGSSGAEEEPNGSSGPKEES